MALETLTAGQVAFFLTYFATLCYYAYAAYLGSRRPVAADKREEDVEGSGSAGKHDGTPLLPKGSDSSAAGPATRVVCYTDAAGEPSTARGAHGSDADAASTANGAGWLSNGFTQCVALNPAALVQHVGTLQAMAEFGTLMAWYFLCDRSPLFWEGDKAYSRDLFLFLFLALTAVAFGASGQSIPKPSLLNRPQTEEWKGWMQVLFLLYHYYEARESYNAIRIFIAAYVWMTGFGNFTYYYKTGDFGIGRFAQMMWRLNFLVFFACVVLNNSYMLYYICPLHTLFTVAVYGSLALRSDLNKSPLMLAAKTVACFAAVAVVWDVQGVFHALWRPFEWLVGYSDPRKESADTLHEWYFRSGLDRYIWIYGMLCAYFHPQATKALEWVDGLEAGKKWAVRGAALAAGAFVAVTYHATVFSLPKAQYNALHPYTSWIPITLWILLRNCTPWLKGRHLRLYGWLGCITLETYISQFHIWLHTDIPDGQPKYLLTVLPGYPLLNFALVTAAYIYISHRLFELTNALKNACIPHDDNRRLARNVVMLAVWGAVAWAAGVGAKGLLALV